MHKYGSSFKHWLARQSVRFVVINWSKRFCPNKITFHRWWCWVLLSFFLSTIFENWPVDIKIILISTCISAPTGLPKTLKTIIDIKVVRDSRMFCSKQKWNGECKRFLNWGKTVSNTLYSKFKLLMETFCHWGTKLTIRHQPNHVPITYTLV